LFFHKKSKVIFKKNTLNSFIRIQLVYFTNKKFLKLFLKKFGESKLILYTPDIRKKYNKYTTNKKKVFL